MFFTPEKFGRPANKKPDVFKSVIRPPKKREFMTDEELIEGAHKGLLVYDVESYPNYFCVSFTHFKTRKVLSFVDSPAEQINTDKLLWVMFHYMTCGFNNNKYDIIVLSAAISGFHYSELNAITKDIIENKLREREIEDKYKFKILQPHKINTFDMIEVCPLSGSLKKYGARLHCERLQDLPYPINDHLTSETAQNVLNYNYNDNDITCEIVDALKEQLNLRLDLGRKYGLDLRSKSDAQIAEIVIGSEIAKIKNSYPRKPKLPEGYTFKYKAPDFIKFKTPYLNELLDLIQSVDFVLDKGGSPRMPTIKHPLFSQTKDKFGFFNEFNYEESESTTKKKEKKALKLKIADTEYTVGVGGLHSCEKSAAHYADDNYVLKDVDVESFYPRIVLICKLFPKHIGEAFLKVYEEIVDRRVKAKGLAKSTDLAIAELNQIAADSLKIVINGTFGKLGSKYSILYSPDLLLQVTITGQLSLLMLIESIELAGIPVVSANTDGIVIKCLRSRENELDAIVKLWEQGTGFKTEETFYKALFSRDVNNYIAVKTDGKCKLKGAYSNPWNDKKTAIFRFHKNPATTICIDAVCDFITKDIPLEQTIRECDDIKKFVFVREVKGGGYKGEYYLGKIVRWYYANDVTDGIYYVGSGNKVSESDGAKPIMDLPDNLPDDIDYSFYVSKCKKIMKDIGFYSAKTSLF